MTEAAFTNYLVMIVGGLFVIISAIFGFMAKDGLQTLRQTSADVGEIKVTSAITKEKLQGHIEKDAEMFDQIGKQLNGLWESVEERQQRRKP